ncbi:MAG: aminoacyl-tRNA hydrolase [Kofleriaceae bacterium]|nr:aminoacyl-tRNA hydrolase [Kofleriaceae bacterium]MBP6838131.1 aminoacyl-tRNA hydrolase [Kofleriaceae bacterium]MBP9206323.1 aminoacyl-tRNA hydrolase [Kofleriaceae bacterium]
MWLIVGLGNPGPKYARNRHNVGFRVVEELARAGNLPAWKGNKLGGETTSGVIDTPRGRIKVTLLRPMEFMNVSGFAVQKTAAFLGVGTDELLIIHDDIDLDFGAVRVKTGGGHGGQNGVRSIIDQLGGAGFARVRIGVGKPGPRAGAADGGAAEARAAGNRALGAAAAGTKDVAGWVLADFPAAQAATVDRILASAADAARAVVGLGAGPAMNDWNGRPLIT